MDALFSRAPEAPASPGAVGRDAAVAEGLKELKASAHGAPPAPNLPACLHARAIIHAHPAPHREPLGERDEDTFIRASDPCDVVISVCGL